MLNLIKRSKNYEYEFKDTTIHQHYQERIKSDRYASGYPFVTISREAGAGRRALAEALQAETEKQDYGDLFRGWKICDESFCEEVARDPDMHVSMQELLSEEYHTRIQEFLGEVAGEQTPQYTVLKKIFSIERPLAGIGKVIVVGRARNYVTRDLPGGIYILAWWPRWRPGFNVCRTVSTSIRMKRKKWLKSRTMTVPV